MPAQVLVVGLDGADWSLAEPLLAQGALPHLAALRARGAHAVLESTVPPVTFPAWNTFLTGVNPGRHGVLDFTRWVPGRYEVRFTGGGARRVPSLLEYLSQAGRRVASVGLPGTWPPPELPGGFVLSGFDAPVAIGPGPDFARPRELYERVVRRHGPWVYADIDELRVAPGWHRRARARLEAGLARKGRIARALLDEADWDLFLVHLGETDTVGHHFLAFHDPGHPRRPAHVHPEEAGAVEAIYRRADAVLGELVAAAGEGVAVLVASDHGMVGASDRTLHLNRALADGGFLAFAGAPSLARRAVARAQALALRHLPARAKERLFRALGAVPSRLETARRLGGVDLARSVAFSEELTYAPSVRLNVRGREPRGGVAPEDVEAVRQAITAHLLALRDPDTGEALVAAVRPREAVLSGPATVEAPDLYVEPAAPGGYPLTVLPSAGPGPVAGRLQGAARLGGKGRGPVGVHRRDGVLLLAAPGAPVGDLGRVPMAACAPTLLALCGVAEPEGLEAASLLGRAAAPAAPAGGPVPVAPAADATYTAEEEALIAARLRGLGYLD